MPARRQEALATGRPAPRTRQTREESQRQTREALLASAREVFVERGFHAASVEEIAARAGYTRGAVYSNFADKDEIFVALMDDKLEERVDTIRRILAESSPLDVFAALRDDGGGDDPAWLPLLAEFRAHALRNEAARAKLGERHRALRGLYAQAIELLFDSVGLAPPRPAADLALVVQAFDLWFPMQRALDPDDVDPGAFYDLLDVLFQAGVALAERDQR
jgi:AcrR family transcriptional regulator